MEYIFPFWKFNNNDKIVIYGAGRVGMDYYSTHSLLEWGSIVLWVDRYVRSVWGIQTDKVEDITNEDIDYVLIALSDVNTAKEVKHYLLDLGIDIDKILWFEPDVSADYSVFLSWYYDCFSIKPNRRRIFCRFIEIGFDMLLNFVNDFDDYRFETRILDGIESGLRIYGYGAARKGKYEEIKNDQFINIGYWPFEADIPNYTILDYSFTSINIRSDKNCWCFSFYPQNDMIQERSNLKVCAKNKFCNFIYSNPSFGDGSVIRQNFCALLSEYKRIDCPGKVLNNMDRAITPREGNWIDGKMNFISQYKFTIAFENKRIDGYITEKLFQPLMVGSIPIYWGGNIENYINKESVIDCSDYDDDFEAVVEHVKEVDNDIELYEHMVKSAPLKAPYHFDWKSNKRQAMKKIIDNNHLSYFD